MKDIKMKNKIKWWLLEELNDKDIIKFDAELERVEIEINNLLMKIYPSEPRKVFTNFPLKMAEQFQ